ncbi:MAG: hypothetical protein ABSH22_14650 [Tepidisphaeraceae bacterium]
MLRGISVIAGLVISLTLQCGTVFAGSAEGDPQMLSMIADANKKNVSQIQTWVGSANIDTVLRRAGHKSTIPTLPASWGPMAWTLIPHSARAGGLDSRVKFTSTFAMDIPLQMKRLSWRVTEAKEKKEDGTLADAPEQQMQNRDLMLRPDGFFVLANAFRRVGSTQWERGLVIWPATDADRRSGPLARDLDPVRYMYVFNHPVPQYVTHVREMWPQFAGSSADLKVNRSGDVVEIDYTGDNKKKDESINRTRYDLAKGANVIEEFASGMGITGKTTIDYVQLSGVWVPSVVHQESVHLDRDGTEIEYWAETVRFVTGQINTPLSAKDFTPEMMGVVPETRVSDDRN